MSLLAIRQAVVDAIRAGLPLLRHCEPHPGRFESEEEVKRHAVRGLAVLVGVLGVDGLEERSGEAVGEVVFVAYVVAGDGPNTPRDAAALALAQALALLAPGNRWGLDAAESAPARLRADNLYSARLDKLGVAVWAVSWRQRFSLGSALDPATLDLFATFDARHATGADNAPVAEDLVELPQEE